MSSGYEPPFMLTPEVVRLVGEIAEATGRWTGTSGTLPPPLRRAMRAQSVQASLEIEGSTLSVEDVTAVLEGRRARGSWREIREVQNASRAYDALRRLDPVSEESFLEAHGILMAGLIKDAGAYRRGAVGIQRGGEIVHLAPPADRVPFQVRDLLGWIETSDHHPLVVGAVAHYEIEFIHPFSDGNGRMGRLWQTAVLAAWQAGFAYLPVETVIRDRQAAYYEALAASDRRGDAEPFLAFVLPALRDALRAGAEGSPARSGDRESDYVSDYVSDHVKRLLKELDRRGPTGAAGLMKKLGLRHRPSFRLRYLRPALVAGLVEMTAPETPRSPAQRYRLTPRGAAVLRGGGG